MIPTFLERQQLGKEFSSEVERMRRCLEAAGHHFKVDCIVWAWADYSDAVCATWLSLPDEGKEPELLAILLKHLPPAPTEGDEPATFFTRVVDAGDGSGDVMMEMPDELLVVMGWKEGDVLAASINSAGKLLLKRRGG